MRHSLQAALFLVGAMLALSACSHNAKPVDKTPLADRKIEELIGAPSGTAFEVVFSYTRGAPGGGPGLFVWRQSKGRRRWDGQAAVGYDEGWFLVDDEFQVGRGVDPAKGRDCTWDGFRNGSTVTMPFVSCGGDKTGIGLMGALSAMLKGRISGHLPSQVIHGISADCYSIVAQFRPGEASLCVDAARRIPLSFEGSDGEERHAISAVAVVTQAPTLRAPIDDLAIEQPAERLLPSESLDLPHAIADNLVR